MAVSRGDGSYGRLLVKLAKTDLLAIDDWLIAPLKDSERRDLLEIVEDRYGHASTLIATQLPITAWHEAIGEPTLADAICDRLVHRAHRIELKGSSMRERQEKAKSSPDRPGPKPKTKD
jgi:DNA replication protein DnaC